jgi:hypothetical protein
MRRTLFMLLATCLAAACMPDESGTKEPSAVGREGTGEGQFDAQGTFDSSRAKARACDDTGGTHINLFYGNYRIETAGFAYLKAGEMFAIRLKPQNDSNNRPGIDYEVETVTISGKDLASVWLTASGSFASTPPPHHELVICVPSGTPNGSYYYNIGITQTGSLDPRAEVF